MKCHAGVEFESGKPCPKCGAKLGEVCWPGINTDLAALPKMTEGYNGLRDALSWFDSHEVETKLGHLPQWVVVARALKLS